MTRVDCPHCGKLGTVTGERVIKAGSAAVTTYFCDACHTEWDERDDSEGIIRSVRTRPPKTRRDKQSEP